MSELDSIFNDDWPEDHRSGVVAVVGRVVGNVEHRVDIVDAFVQGGEEPGAVAPRVRELGRARRELRATAIHLELDEPARIGVAAGGPVGPGEGGGGARGEPQEPELRMLLSPVVQRARASGREVRQVVDAHALAHGARGGEGAGAGVGGGARDGFGS